MTLTELRLTFSKGALDTSSNSVLNTKKIRVSDEKAAARAKAPHVNEISVSHGHKTPKE